MEQENIEDAQSQITTRFGVILLGAPGTGKSTFCAALQDFYANNLDRPHCIINLDPANEHMKYQCDIDIRELIDLNDVMRSKDDEEQPGLGLGPNGAMIYCMQFLEQNIGWLVQKIEQKQCRYFLIDMPGQTELYTNHDSLKRILEMLNEKVNFQCCAAHLVDCSYLMDVHKYLSACTLSMTAKIAIGDYPMINIMTKIDILKNLGRPQMNLIDLENLSGLSYLFWGLGDDDSEEEGAPKKTQMDAFNKKYGKMSKSLCDVVENYMGFTGFLLMDLSCKELLCHAIGQFDKANGYFEQPEKVQNKQEMQIDYQAIEMYVSTQAVGDIYTKYIEVDEEMEEQTTADSMKDEQKKFGQIKEDAVVQTKAQKIEIIEK